MIVHRIRFEFITAGLALAVTATVPTASHDNAAPDHAVGRLTTDGPIAVGSPIVRVRSDPEAGGSASDVRTRYRKHEYRIPMRDGVSLFTAVYTPVDTASTYPILLLRTPYGAGPYGPDAYPEVLRPGRDFERSGYIFVYQDVRGRFKSGGTFVHMTPHKDVKHGNHDVDESTDTYDTIDWLIRTIARNNGRVGLWGISYAGFYAAAGAIDAHPALKAVSPQAPQADWFLGDDVHHNGAFLLTSAFNWMAMCGRRDTTAGMACGDPFDFGTPDGYKFFLDLGALPNADAKYFHGAVPGWTELMDHGTYDSLWRSRDILPHLRDIQPAILTVGGWYDANNLYGALHVYESIRQQSPNTSARLVVGPWWHGQWSIDAGDSINSLRFGAHTGAFFRSAIQFPFFEQYLKGRATSKLASVYAFQTGANKWRTFDAWPPPAVTARSLYLHAGGVISLEAPTDTSSGAFDEYVSDPARPVPYVPVLSTNMDPDYMSQDQRFAAGRPDVLVYESPPLDSDVTIAGPVAPDLVVSTTGTDADWVVKLIDVYPEQSPGERWAGGHTQAALDAKSKDRMYYAEQASPMRGFEELVRGDVLRGKFRDGLDRPMPFTSGTPTHVRFAMLDVLHTFKRGHRIMIQIQSTWFPLVDRNPQRFEDIYHATDGDFQKATQRVYRSATQSSAVVVGVLPSAAPDGGPATN
jgi:putative CocE/NonD family hydrolase